MANLNYYKHKIKQLSITEWLIGINCVMFALTQVIDLINGEAFLILGAKINLLIAFGEYWRLIASMFLHGDLMHLIFNMLALYVLGRDIERFYGKQKYLILYFFSGLLGSITSFVFIPNVSVGASGAIFGLMGANLYLYKLNPIVYKKIYGSDFLILIGINVVLGFIRPNIDIAGHLGGLVAGFFIAMAIGLSYEKLFTVKKALMQALLVIVTFIYMAIGLYVNKNEEIEYASGAYFYLTKGNTEKSLDIITTGLEKFPDSSDLKQIKTMLP